MYIPKIGIVGGMGPLAGVDLHKKIIEVTNAKSDQEHIDIIHISFPSAIEDRTRYVLGESEVNPADSICNIIELLISAGANILAIPCNTTHTPVIFNKLNAFIDYRDVILLNMVQEVVQHINEIIPNAKRIGVLSTSGTAAGKAYDLFLEKTNKTVVYPCKSDQEALHNIIYDRDNGIKSKMTMIPENFQNKLSTIINNLCDTEIDALVLACTELPLVLQASNIRDIPIIDSTYILAKALVRTCLYNMESK